MSKIYEIYGDNSREMTIALMKVADVKSMISPDSKVCLKPNLVTDETPENGATTHPGVLEGCIEYLQSVGVKDTSITEGSWLGTGTMRSFKTVGYDKICDKYGIEFYDLKKDEYIKVPTAYRTISISRRIMEADLVIDLPVLKGHCQTRMTCALKNLKGCLPDGEKRRFHSEGLHRPIAALASAIKPGLIIVDSICGDLNFEEGGTPVRTNRMFIGTDPVQIDTYGCRLMGIPVEDVDYIEMAMSYGAGVTELSDDDIIALNEPAASADYTLIPNAVRRLTGHVHEDSACSVCFASLVRALYEKGSAGNEEIYIGQGWKGQELKGLGIGNCCKCAVKNVKGCPPSAADIMKML